GVPAFFFAGMEYRRRRMKIGPRLSFAVAALFLGTGFALTAESEQAAQKPYTVEDGKVDKKTFNGWRRYTESCLRCHGPDGAGSSYAPDLLDSLKTLSEDQFKEVVVNGRQNVSASQTSVMPPFGEVEDVMLYIDDIYAYLKARSDGAIDRGRPQRIGD